MFADIFGKDTIVKEESGEAVTASSAEGTAFGPDANASPAPGRVETVRNLSRLSLPRRLKFYSH